MLVFIAILLALVPAVAILYPFVRRSRQVTPQDESSPQAELARRWDSAVSGLQSTELERSIRNLSTDDYEALRHRYMTEAALVMKSMELEEQEEREMLAAVETEVRQVHERILGEKGASETGRLPAD